LAALSLPPGGPALAADKGPQVELAGEVQDEVTGQLLPARLYVTDGSAWHHVASADPAGSAVEYRRERPNTPSVEIHTTLSAHAFRAALPPGRYRLVAERGKEYLPASVDVELADRPVRVTLTLLRWTDMAARGWYSGDTHVHRPLAELPNALMAEDLNVALPLTGWVRAAGESPRETYALGTGQVETNLFEVDPTHVYYPLNTEWEIFTVGGQSHTLGAVFALGHREPFALGAPPVRPIADEARRQGALLDLDKHNWPWSMMIVPVMDVDLFELANNHVWRTRFAFSRWYPEYAAPYMGLAMPEGGFDEESWLHFGFETYYTLLNCGFRLRPTGGTASGVHPVPLGFGRVYVHLPDGFGYERWMAGLDAGRSFVTTGPMLLVEANGQPPGHTFQLAAGERPRCRLTGTAEGPLPIERIEVVVNGEVARRLDPEARPLANGGFAATIDESLDWEGSGWVAVRCFYREADGGLRFAHSSPVFFDVADAPLRPRKAETAYLVQRIEAELARHEGVLPQAALDEYRRALDLYRQLDETARP
jgi:hypothetical protein